MLTPKKLKSYSFSLIELIIVVFTLATIASVSMPKIVTLNNFDNDFPVYEVLSAVRYAQRFSMASGCNTKVDLNRNIVSLKRRASCTTGLFTVDLVNPVDGSSSYSVEIPSNVTATTSDLPIYFDKTGRSFDDLYEECGDDDDIQNATISIGSKNIYVIGETGFSYAE